MSIFANLKPLKHLAWLTAWRSCLRGTHRASIRPRVRGLLDRRTKA